LAQSRHGLVQRPFCTANVCFGPKADIVGTLRHIDTLMQTITRASLRASGGLSTPMLSGIPNDKFDEYQERKHA
jgi:hypothetical protein